MNLPLRIPLFVGALSLALPISAQADRVFGKLHFQPCTLAADFGAQSLDAQCAKFVVPENRAAPNGRKISLSIAWLPTKGDAEADPVFLIAGGPGQSALESFPMLAAELADVRKKRNLILVDQRGTGGSNKLACPDAQGDDAFGNGDLRDMDKIKAYAQRCAQSLAAHADPRFYSTTDAIADLDAVRATLGAERINLYGVSYGTRVAQQYARHYPQHTRTVTLDGVVPNTLVLGNEFAKNLEASLDRQFALCTAQKTCGDKLGNPRQRLNALLALVDKAPPTVRYRDAVTGDSREEKLTRDRIAMLARMFAYAPTAAGVLPLELFEAAQGRYEPIMALSNLLSTTLGGSITGGMELSVVCTEDAGEQRVDPRDAGSLLGTDMTNAIQTQCSVWPHGARPADFRQPLSGNVPVLLMSGEFDPVTPPRYGDEVLKSLSNARHLVVRGQGHNVLPVGCMPKLFARFLDTADAKSLDVSCLAKVPYAQPFSGFYGWDP